MSMPQNFIETHQLKYMILDRRDDSQIELKNRVYLFWKDLWVNECIRVGKTNEIFADDFFRADLIAVLYNEREIIGCHLYTYFDMRNLSAQEHTYFHGLAEDVIPLLKMKNLNKTITMEYLSVNSNWRKSKVGYALADTLIFLGQKTVQHYGLDAGIGTARLLTKIDQRTQNLGFLETSIIADRHGFECKFMYYTPHLNVQMQIDGKTLQLSELLWTAFLNQTNNTNTLLRVA